MTPRNSRLLDDPIRQFELWFDEATNAGIKMPDAMCLATVSAAGRPSARMVLFKGMLDGGFTFYTNYGSRKATELDGNSSAAVVFHWKEIERQVRVEGTVQRVSAERSDAYYATRGRASRLSAWASRQSRPCSSREVLDRQYREIQDRFEGQDVPRPEFWGGFRLEPECLEFWAGLPDRFHDRWVYRREAGSWTRQRLQP